MFMKVASMDKIELVYMAVVVFFFTRGVQLFSSVLIVGFSVFPSCKRDVHESRLDG